MPRVHLDRVDAEGFSALADEYVVLTSGGSTGEPGVFCWSLDEMARFGASAIRWSAANREGPPARAAWIAARSPRHPSAVAALLSGAALIAVDQPVAEIVEQLNAIRPDAISTVCSMLPLLVEEARRGNLEVPVEHITVFGDVLDPDAADAATEVFGVQPVEGYPTTDVGYVAHQAPGEPGLYLNEDLLLVEAVDDEERPVAPGVVADHVLVTSLHQRTTPLIRYRVDDRVVVDPEPGRYAAYRRLAWIDGRSDDVFHYRNVSVHPHVFRTAIGRHLGVRDYEVRQIERGAVVRVVAGPSPVDVAALAGEIRGDWSRPAFRRRRSMSSPSIVCRARRSASAGSSSQPEGDRSHLAERASERRACRLFQTRPKRSTAFREPSVQISCGALRRRAPLRPAQVTLELSGERDECGLAVGWREELRPDGEGPDEAGRHVRRRLADEVPQRGVRAPACDTPRGAQRAGALPPARLDRRERQGRRQHDIDGIEDGVCALPDCALAPYGPAFAPLADEPIRAEGVSRPRLESLGCVQHGRLRGEDARPEDREGCQPAARSHADLRHVVAELAQRVGEMLDEGTNRGRGARPHPEIERHADPQRPRLGRRRLGQGAFPVDRVGVCGRVGKQVVEQGRVRDAAA